MKNTLHNIKDYPTYINENNPRKIIINGKTNNITIDGRKFKNVADDDLYDEIITTATYPYMKSLTGQYKGGNIEQNIKNGKDSIEKILNSSTYPETDTINIDDGVYFYEFPKEKLSQIIDVFKIKSSDGKSIGSGEVLFSAYYKNVRRTKIFARGGESGDCEYIDNDGKKYIEIKAADAPFKTFEWYKKNVKRLKINSDDEIYNTIEDKDKLEYFGGIASYIYLQKQGKDLDFVLFNGEVRNSNSMTGYLVIQKKSNDTLESIIEKLNKLELVYDKDDSKGGKLSRDFTISCKYNEEQKKCELHIHIRTKE